MPAAVLPDAGLVSFTVSSGGEELSNLDGIYQIESVHVSKGINRISEARLELLDGDPATGLFPVSDAATFVPGTAVAIQAGYDNTNALIFKGIVVSVGLRAEGEQGSRLVVTCKDEAVKMSGGRAVLPFPDQTASDAIKTVVGAYSGVSASIAVTSAPQPNLMQYNRSDWDFVVTQAEANGQVVVSDQNKLATVKLATDASPVVTLQYGTNVYSFDLTINARTQFGAVKAESWSSEEQKTISVTANDPGLNTPGNLKSGELATAVGQATYTLRTAANVDEASLQALADAQRARLALAKVQGTVEMAGTSLVVPGSMVSLDGLGARFNGNGYVTGVAHSLVDGGWRTQITLGTDEQWFGERHPDVVPPTGGQNVASGAQGLYSAVVKATQPDPDSGFRVQVTVAALADAELWVRLAQPYASSGLGMYFYPEVGDEVVLGFFGDDARYPVILGSLYSKGRAPAYTPDEKNTKKAIVTSSKLTVEFDDENKVLTLKTAGGNQLVITDKDKGLVLTDQQGNTITMSDAGLTLVSKSALKLTATNDISIESSGGNVNIKAGADVKMQGLNVNATATTQLALKSSGTAELSAGMQTTVKGVMVMIN